MLSPPRERHGWREQRLSLEAGSTGPPPEERALELVL